MGVSIIVLAAGSSTRMGRPKPLLEFDGTNCLSLVMSACLGSSAGETILVLGPEAERIRAAFAAMPLDDGHSRETVRIIENDQHARGQTSSLKAGLEAVSPRSDGFIVFPVDHPLVTSSIIDALIERFEPRPRGRTIFIASHEEGRGHPVLFSAVHRAPVLELGDDEPLHNYIRVREGEIEQVPCESPGVIMPMNTPEEYQQVLSVYRGRAAAS